MINDYDILSLPNILNSILDIASHIQIGWWVHLHVEEENQQMMCFAT